MKTLMLASVIFLFVDIHVALGADTCIELSNIKATGKKDSSSPHADFVMISYGSDGQSLVGGLSFDKGKPIPTGKVGVTLLKWVDWDGKKVGMFQVDDKCVNSEGKNHKNNVEFLGNHANFHKYLNVEGLKIGKKYSVKSFYCKNGDYLAEVEYYAGHSSCKIQTWTKIKTELISEQSKLNTLYGLRGKHACFVVQMMSGGSIHLADFGDAFCKNN